MTIRYSRWRPDDLPDDRRLEQMVTLFSHLLIQTNGDANEALQWLKMIAEEYGLLEDGMTMDDIVQKLRDMGLIEDAGKGVQLTQRGVQRIRQDALREIFTSLKKGTTGIHETPFTGLGAERTCET